MNKNKMYSYSKVLENTLVLVIPTLLLVGFRWFPSVIRLSAFLLIIFGIFYFVRFAYFKKTQVLFTDSGTGPLALIYVLFVGVVMIAVGIYVLMHL